MNYVLLHLCMLLLFINEGETIEIDTRDGSYVGRVKA